MFYKNSTCWFVLNCNHPTFVADCHQIELARKVLVKSTYCKLEPFIRNIAAGWTMIKRRDHLTLKRKRYFKDISNNSFQCPRVRTGQSWTSAHGLQQCDQCCYVCMNLNVANFQSTKFFPKEGQPLAASASKLRCTLQPQLINIVHTCYKPRFLILETK